MEERTGASANVDVCTACYGVWIEWFDGEIPRVAASIPPPSRRPDPPTPGRWKCPACLRELVHEPGPSGATVARCGECAGAFVTRASILVLQDHAAAPPTADEPPTLLERIAALLREIFEA